MDKIHKIILEEVPRSNTGRISKNSLLLFLAMQGIKRDDRGLRDAVYDLRCLWEGRMLCASLSKPGGYYMAQDLETLDKAIGSDERRAIKILQRCRIQRKNADLGMNPLVKAEIDSQKEMFESVGGQLVLMAQGHSDPVSYLRPDGKRK